MGSTRSVLSRRSVRRRVLVVALVVTGLAVWQGVAVAGSLHRDASLRGKTPIEFQNASCGDSTGAADIGWAKVQRRKSGKLQIDWRLTSGTPGTTYTVSLWDYESCTMIATLGTVKTDSKGKAFKSFKYKLTSDVTSVFTDGFDGVSANDSLHIEI